MIIEKPEQNISFPKVENDILEFWKKENIFEKSLEQAKDAEPWTFYDGPPFATGLPHYGHLLAGTIKDVVPRYWSMMGYKVERRFGWDCHGLPVEFEVEKNLKLQGRQDIVEYGVDKFNEACRSIVLRYTKEWQQTVERMGRWVDFDNGYRTMDLDYMESVWAVFKKLWEKGLIYEDKKVLPYSTPIASPLSNFESNLNYQQTQDPSVYVKLKLQGEANTFLLIWTTTPWTLPANMAVAVQGKDTYLKVKCKDETYIIHENRVDAVIKQKLKLDYQVIKSIEGKSLQGLKYDQLIAGFEKNHNEHSCTVYCADYVTADSGTGLVHIAPSFGEDDYALGKKFKLEAIDHLDAQGVFLASNTIAQGEYFKDANKSIIGHLKNNGNVLLQETVNHSYPFCYRSDTPLIYRAISTWFVNVTDIKDKLIKNNQAIHWMPKHVKDGRFGKWLDNAKDWAISRNRFWGNPIPVWRNDKTSETICLGSKDELEHLADQSVQDLHKHFIDKIEIKSPKTGDTLKRVPHVLDCWFESGSMPYAQQHYPFDMDDTALKNIFPADFIAEGLDQTRGWFYTLMVLSTALFDEPAFKNVIVNGIILAKDGRKMSKRLKNYPDPSVLIEKYGADALRLYLMQSSAVLAEDIKFSEEAVQEAIRKMLLPIYNAYSFFATYAAIDKYDPSHTDWETVDFNGNELDQWIVCELKKMQNDFHVSMQEFNLQTSVKSLYSFIDTLNNWYIRRSRKRFWKSENDSDKTSAFNTLHFVLNSFVKCLASVAPFFSEYLFLKLNSNEAQSVHLCKLPKQSPLSDTDNELIKKMLLARQICALGRDLREKLKIKIRQPLAKIFIGVLSDENKKRVNDISNIITQELNVKNIELVPFSKMAKKHIKPNFKRLGKRLGKGMKAFSQACQNLSDKDIDGIFAGKDVQINNEQFAAADFVTELKVDDNFAYTCLGQKDFVIAFDNIIDENLEFEGIARELINKVQNFRKESNLKVEDRIALSVQCSDLKLLNASEMFKKTIESETLSIVTFDEALDNSTHIKDEDIDGLELKIGISKTG